jgi:hypothetical protein
VIGRFAFLAMFGVVACDRDTAIRGVVSTAWDDLSPLAGAEITLFDGLGEPLDEGTSGPDGAFEVTAPSQSYVFLEVGGDGLVPATFNSETGSPGVLSAASGALYGVSQATFDAWIAPFADCDGFGSPGGVVYGEVRAINAEGSPILPTGFVFLEDDEDRTPACVLNDEGTAARPVPEDADAARLVGIAGRFAIFGVTPGAYALAIGQATSNQTSEVYRHGVLVRDGGVVPRMPAWVEIPILGN